MEKKYFMDKLSETTTSDRPETKAVYYDRRVLGMSDKTRIVLTTLGTLLFICELFDLLFKCLNIWWGEGGTFEI